MIIKNQTIPIMKQKIPFQVVSNQHAILMPIGDIHYGVSDFPKRKLQYHIQWSLDRGAIFIGMGDYLDFTSSSQIKQIIGLRDETKKEIDHMVKHTIEELYEILKPTEGKWLGMIEGHHRWEFENGVSSDQYLCELLRCDFLGTSALIKIHPEKTPKGHPEANTVIFAHHGIGSSRKVGGNLNRVEDILEWVEADIYLMGHSHAKIVAPIDYQIITTDNIHTHRTRLIARTGGWLKGYSSGSPQPLTKSARTSRGSYVEQHAYTPTAMGTPCFGIGFEQIEHSKYYKPSIHCSI